MKTVHGLRRVASVATRRNPLLLTSSAQGPTTTIPSHTLIASGASFSSAPAPQMDSKDEWIIPPNLKIDPRSSAASLYGVGVAESYEEEDEEYDDDEETETSSDELDLDLEGNEEEEALEEEDVQELVFQGLDPQYVTPLPERLHQTIYAFPTGEEIGSIHLSPSIFGQDPIRTDILHRCIVYQRNKKRGRRNGGARTKTISEVSGSGMKMRNQKGGGVARAGHKRPAHWRGGAKAHGPKGSIQNYTTKLNKKVRKLGIKMALSQKLKEGNLVLLNGFTTLESYKTKVLAKALVELGNMGGRKGCSAYLVDHVEEEDEDTLTSINGVDVNLEVASANLLKVKVTNQRNVNVYDLIKHEKVVMSLSAFEAIEARYKD